MDKKKFRESRDKAIRFIKAEMIGRKKEYDQFVKEIEGSSLSGGAPGMKKLCDLMWRCLPQECRDTTVFVIRYILGEVDESDMANEVDDTSYDQIIDECMNHGKTIAVCYDGDIFVTESTERSIDGFYLSMSDYERLKNNVPPMLKHSMMESMAAMVGEEEGLDDFWAAMDQTGKSLYLLFGISVPEMLDNLQTVILEEKNQIAIFAYNYILNDRGMQKIAKLLPSILLTGAAGYPGLEMFKSMIQNFVQTSTAAGINDKSSWKEVMDETDNDELWKEIACALRYAEDNKGPNKKIVPLEDMLVNDTQGEILMAIGQFVEENTEAISLAYLLIALEKTNCIRKHYPFSTFVRAINERFNKTFAYQKAQRRYSEITEFPDMLDEKKEAMQKAKKLIEEWKDVFINCNLEEAV